MPNIAEAFPAIRQNEPMSAHTTMKVGGAAQWFLQAQSLKQVKEAVAFCRAEGLPLTVIGRGSNLLVRDGGIDGLVLALGEDFAALRVEEEAFAIEAQAGLSLGALSRKALECGFAGLEFAEGIPGSVGGGVLMNAGAYGGEMSQVVESVLLLTGSGELMELDNAACDYGYRHSAMMEHAQNGGVILSARFSLSPDEPESIRARMEEYRGKRREKQPLTYPSCGSFFKRPQGYFAGKLIQDAGLKGFAVGGAQISSLHAGFVINTGGATARDVLALMEQVQQRVLESSGVFLEPEVRILGKA